MNLISTFFFILYLGSYIYTHLKIKVIVSSYFDWIVKKDTIDMRAEGSSWRGSMGTASDSPARKQKQLKLRENQHTR